MMRLTLLAAAVFAFAAQADERVIVLLPMGHVEPEFLQAAKLMLTDHLNATVRIDSEIPVVKEAFYEPRKRYRAEKILEFVQANPPEGAWKVMVITSVEISTTKGDIKDWGIAGLGNINDVASVASTFLYTKYSKTKAQAAERFGQVVIHEFGHTLGLEHCTVATCAMADFKGKAMTAADKGGRQYCLKCRTKVTPGVLKEWTVDGVK